MIVLPKRAECTKCANNPQVFQPSTDNEVEWLSCDEYERIPTKILKNKQKCEFFKDRQ